MALKERESFQLRLTPAIRVLFMQETVTRASSLLSTKALTTAQAGAGPTSARSAATTSLRWRLIRRTRTPSMHVLLAPDYSKALTAEQAGTLLVLKSADLPSQS